MTSYWRKNSSLQTMSVPCMDIYNDFVLKANMINFIALSKSSVLKVDVTENVLQ